MSKDQKKKKKNLFHLVFVEHYASRSYFHKKWPQPQDNRQGIAIAHKSCQIIPNPQLSKMGNLCWDGCEGYLVDFIRVVLVSLKLFFLYLTPARFLFFPPVLFLSVSLFRMTVMGSEAGKWNKIGISELCVCVTYNGKIRQHKHREHAEYSEQSNPGGIWKK